MFFGTQDELNQLLHEDFDVNEALHYAALKLGKKDNDEQNIQRKGTLNFIRELLRRTTDLDPEKLFDKPYDKQPTNITQSLDESAFNKRFLQLIIEYGDLATLNAVLKSGYLAKSNNVESFAEYLKSYAIIPSTSDSLHKRADIVDNAYEKVLDAKTNNEAVLMYARMTYWLNDILKINGVNTVDPIYHFLKQHDLGSKILLQDQIAEWARILEYIETILSAPGSYWGTLGGSIPENVAKMIIELPNSKITTYGKVVGSQSAGTKGILKIAEEALANKQSSIMGKAATLFSSSNKPIPAAEYFYKLIVRIFKDYDLRTSAIKNAEYIKALKSMAKEVEANKKTFTTPLRKDFKLP